MCRHSADRAEGERPRVCDSPRQVGLTRVGPEGRLPRGSERELSGRDVVSQVRGERRAFATEDSMCQAVEKGAPSISPRLPPSLTSPSHFFHSRRLVHLDSENILWVLLSI